MKEKIKKSVVDMLLDINDVEKLERIHRFVQYIYIQNCEVRSSGYLQDAKAAGQERSHQISSNLPNGMQKKINRYNFTSFQSKSKETRGMEQQDKIIEMIKGVQEEKYIAYIHALLTELLQG